VEKFQFIKTVTRNRKLEWQTATKVIEYIQILSSKKPRPEHLTGELFQRLKEAIIPILGNYFRK
jgi:hypothetical protein